MKAITINAIKNKINKDILLLKYKFQHFQHFQQFQQLKILKWEIVNFYFSQDFFGKMNFGHL